MKLIRKKMIAITAIVIGLGGCGVGFKMYPPHLSFHRTIAVEMPRPTSINPFYAETASDKAFQDFIYTRLLNVTPHGHVASALATHWMANKEQTRWTFSLNPHAKWWNGRPITANDVRWSYMTWRTKSPTLRALIRSVAVVNPVTVTFTLSHKQSTFPLILATARQTQWILPAFTLEHVPSLRSAPSLSKLRLLMGAGPYRPVRRIAGGYEFMANPHYFLGVPKTKFLIWFFHGTHHAAPNIPTITVNRTKAHQKYYRSTIPKQYVLIYNTAHSAINNPLTRAALSQAISRHTLRPLARPFVSNAYSPLYPPTPETMLSSQRYNALAATKHLHEAGYPHLTITLIAPRALGALAQGIAKQYRSIGIHVILHIIPSQRNLPAALQQSPWDVCLTTTYIPTVETLNLYYGPALTPSLTRNWGQYSNAALTRAVSEHDPRAVLTQMASDPPSTFLFWQQRTYSVAQTIHNFRSNPFIIFYQPQEWRVR